MPFRYVPLLRSKTGEATALRQLDNAAKSRIFPLMHVATTPPATFVPKMIGAWAGKKLAVDGAYNYNLKGAANDTTAMINALGVGKVEVTPCIEHGITAPYISAITPLINKFSPGLVVKTSLGDLPSVHAWVTAQGWQPATADLVINMGDVSLYEPTVIAKVVVQELNNHIGQNPP